MVEATKPDPKNKTQELIDRFSEKTSGTGSKSRATSRATNRSKGKKKKQPEPEIEHSKTFVKVLELLKRRATFNEDKIKQYIHQGNLGDYSQEMVYSRPTSAAGSHVPSIRPQSQM